MKISRTLVKILYLGLVSALIFLSCGPAPASLTEVSAMPGQWKWKSTVEIVNNASASCPLKTGDSVITTISIKYAGGSNLNGGEGYSYTLTGFGTDSLHGITSASNGGGSAAELNFQGSYVVGTGRKTDSASSIVSVEPSYAAMDGEEVWSWAGTGASAGITCSGRSAINATKL